MELNNFFQEIIISFFWKRKSTCVSCVGALVSGFVSETRRNSEALLVRGSICPRLRKPRRYNRIFKENLAKQIGVLQLQNALVWISGLEYLLRKDPSGEEPRDLPLIDRPYSLSFGARVFVSVYSCIWRTER